MIARAASAWLLLAGLAAGACAPARPVLKAETSAAERERALQCHQQALDARPNPLKSIAVGTGVGALAFPQYSGGFWPAAAGLAFVGAVVGGSMSAFKVGQERDDTYTRIYAGCITPLSEQAPGEAEPEPNPEAYWP